MGGAGGGGGDMYQATHSFSQSVKILDQTGGL